MSVSLSFLKLFGWPIYRALFASYGLPEIVVFNTHLHDYIVCEQSYRRLPAPLRLAWGINKHAGLRYYAKFVSLLQAKGYEFVSMTQLHEYTTRLSQDESCPRREN